MNDQDKKLAVLNDGRIAALAADHFGALIHELKMRRMNEMSQNFRMNKIEQATLVACVAGICALEDLENEIKRKILRGEKVSNDLHHEETQ
jgi:hypothetical protein